MQPCTHCTGTDHAPEDCNRALLKCDICFVNGHNTAACNVYCTICKKSRLHLELHCTEYQQQAPLLSSSPPLHAEPETMAEGSGTQGDGTGSTHTTPTRRQEISPVSPRNLTNPPLGGLGPTAKSSPLAPPWPPRGKSSPWRGSGATGVATNKPKSRREQ